MDEVGNGGRKLKRKRVWLAMCKVSKSEKERERSEKAREVTLRKVGKKHKDMERQREHFGVVRGCRIQVLL